MAKKMIRTRWLMALGCGLLAMPGVANAQQFQLGNMAGRSNGLMNNPFLNNNAGRIVNQTGPLNPYNPGQLVVNPFGPNGFNPYFPNGYGYDFGLGNTLSGAANVISAQGQLMVDTQQAYIMREQARSARFDNRRKALDEYLYEREKTPTAEDERQRLLKQQLARSRNNTPTTEIWSGKALNDILGELRNFPTTGGDPSLRTFTVPLDDEGLKHINVVSSRSSGNVGLLKNGGKLSWPFALDTPDFKDQRDHVTQLIGDAVKQAEFGGRVDSAVVRDLKKDVAELQKLLKKSVDEMPISSYIEGKNYLNNLDAAIAALMQPDINKYLTGKYDLRGKTMAELVKYMIDNGLQFAPAVSGDESAYLSLHSALATYSNIIAPASTSKN